MSKIFNRKDEQVKKDALELSLEEFIQKYKETKATEEVLISTHKSFDKVRKMADKVNEASTEATSFVPVEKEIEEPKPLIEKAAPPKEIKRKPTTKVMLAVEAKVASQDKPGRTPRMRELIKLHTKEDKQKIKRLLDEEGYNTGNTAFHSEWNRLTRAK
jgi:hypothetical protein